jgi:Peptidase family M48
MAPSLSGSGLGVCHLLTLSVLGGALLCARTGLVGQKAPPQSVPAGAGEIGRDQPKLKVTWQPANPENVDQVIDRIISREHVAVTTLRRYSPLVETYIQNVRPESELGTVPAGDKYFLGRAELASGVELRSLTEKSGITHKMFGGLKGFFSFAIQYLPGGFLQMIFIDTNGFDRQHYNFEYVRRVFLGEVRCLVFNVTPLPHAGKGRFLGRIWVEDQDYTIVRFNGAYSGNSRSSLYFHFDSWRLNAGPGSWLPAYVYSEESNLHYALAKRLRFKAQTRLWGYNLSRLGQEQELSRVLVEAPTPVHDETEAAKDLSPVQVRREWDREAEDNVIERLEGIGLLAPSGEVDKVLETVVNNLEVTNNLDIQPEVRCRVLLTSTLESFTVGHTIVLSRGLIDVLPEEATLATMLAHELGHILLGHRIDPQYAFFDRLLFDDKDTFKHFIFSRPPGQEEAASRKAAELLKNSPYKDKLGSAARFAQALNDRAKQIPNLISPHLGNRVPVDTAMQTASVPPEVENANQLVALPLGSRIKVDPWSGRIEMLKSKPVASIAEWEKMPFEVTPFLPYLTRQSASKTSATK